MIKIHIKFPKFLFLYYLNAGPLNGRGKRWDSRWGSPAVYWQLNAGYEYRMAPLPFCSAPIPRIRTFERRMVLEAQNFNLTRLVCYNCKLSPTSSALQSFQAPSVEKGKGTVSKRLGSRVLHRSLSFGPNARYVNHKLPGAGGGGGP